MLIIGALNWGIIGIVEINVLEALLEAIFQPAAADMLARILYALVGLAGVYLFYPLYRMTRETERSLASQSTR